MDPAMVFEKNVRVWSRRLGVVAIVDVTAAGDLNISSRATALAVVLNTPNFLPNTKLQSLWWVARHIIDAESESELVASINTIVSGSSEAIERLILIATLTWKIRNEEVHNIRLSTVLQRVVNGDELEF